MKTLIFLIASIYSWATNGQAQVHRNGQACTHYHVAADISSGTFADARISQSSVTQHQAALQIGQSQIPNLVSDLSGKASLSHTHAAADLTSGTFADARISQSSVTQHQAALQIAESQIPSLVTDLSAKAPLSSPALTGSPTAPTAATGTNTTQVATTAFVQAASNYGSYQTILNASASHTAARVAGTYALGDGDPAAISGTGTLYPIKTIFIAAADFPSVDGKATKLRLRVQLYVNDVAPTGNYTFGLYPITRPGTSGGAAVGIYTLGAVVSGSTTAFNTPAADGLLSGASADFALPSDGHYVIGFISTATVAASSHLHMVAALQKRNN